MAGPVKPKSFELKDDYSAPEIRQGNKIISLGDAKTRVVWLHRDEKFNFAAVENRGALGRLLRKKNWVSVTIDGRPLLGNINRIYKRFGISKKEIRRMSPDQLGTFLKAEALPTDVSMRPLPKEEQTILNHVASALFVRKAAFLNLGKNIELYLTNLSSKSSVREEVNNFFSELNSPNYKKVLYGHFFKAVEEKQDETRAKEDYNALLNAIPIAPGSRTLYENVAKERAREALNMESNEEPPLVIFNI